ncbi:hypothetical protein HYS54_03405 [Candidatus Micrarchaeota archaeon]|nr:hypothetical protein [Candidatus Micrarchaeota archaeon]
MVEDAIQRSKDHPTRTELWRSLPKQVQYQTFQIILEYLERSNKITYTRENRIVWIAPNPKLDRLVKKAREL